MRKEINAAFPLPASRIFHIKGCSSKQISPTEGANERLLANLQSMKAAGTEIHTK